MYALLVVIHVIVSIFLIAVILLQAGRGGGLADTFGGSQMQSLFGTKSTTVLTRLTTICAVAFIITCLSLAFISSQRSKSLMEKVKIPEPESAATETVDVQPAAETASETVTPEEKTGPKVDTQGEVQGAGNEVKSK